MPTAEKAVGSGEPRESSARRRRISPVVLAALLGLAAGDALKPPEDQAGTRIALVAIEGYRLGISPLLQRTHLVRCRFRPTCSGYGREAIRRFGWLKGGALTVARIARCQPFAKGGDDPVPDE
jgi:putative membrane protein insertion efficiency factor